MLVVFNCSSFVLTKLDWMLSTAGKKSRCYESKSFKAWTFMIRLQPVAETLETALPKKTSAVVSRNPEMIFIQI